MKKYFKVKTGYARDEFLSIEEKDLAKAIYAHVYGTVFVHDKGTLSGKLIQRIDPDYHRALGLNFEYELKSEDIRALPAGFEKDSLSSIAEATKKVTAALPGKEQKALGVS